MEIKLNLNKENILLKTTDFSIFNYYCPYMNNKKFRGEFRKDPKASASIYQLPSGKYIYKDFGELNSLDCFEYVKKKFNLSFIETLFKINEDLNLNLGLLEYSGSSFSSKTKKLNNSLKPSINYHSTTVIEVLYKNFNKPATNFWNDYHIPVNIVEAYHGYFIKWYRVIKGDKSYKITPNDISFTQNYYIDHLGILRRKIYRPYSEYKWTSNITNLVVQGIKHLPKKGNLLIITKSFKDMLVLRILGFDAVIATNNETCFIPIHIFNKLKKRFKNIILLFDNDKTGVEMSNIFCNEYNLIPFFTPDNKYKDPSDFIKNNNLKITKEYFNQLNKYNE